MRLVVKYHTEKPEFINVAADKMDEHDGIIWAYRDEKLVGIFYVGAVDMAYLSGQTEKEALS